MEEAFLDEEGYNEFVYCMYTGFELQYKAVAEYK